MAKRFKLNLGDVFTIPLNDSEVGFGQSVTPHKKTSGGFMIAVYPIKRNKDQIIGIEEIVTTEPLFLGYTFDALLIDLPRWKIIGNFINNIGSIKMPFHRVISNEEMVLENFKDEKVSIIPEKAFNQLANKVEIAPIRYENALKAHFGLQEWKEDDYDKLLYKHSLKSNEIAESVLGDT